MKKYFLFFVLMTLTMSLTHAQAKQASRNITPKTNSNFNVVPVGDIAADVTAHENTPPVCVTNNANVNQIEIDMRSRLYLGCSYNDDLKIMCGVRIEASDKVVNYAGLSIADALALYESVRQSRDGGGSTLNLCR